MWFYEFFERERGNLIIVTVTVLASIVLSWFDIFNLKYWIGYEFAFAIYFFCLYLIYFVLSAIHELVAVQNRIKIVPSRKYHNENFTGPFTGKNFYGYLDVVIPPGWKITDCYVTLENVVPVYYDDQVLLDKEFSQWYSDMTKPEYKMLHWRSPSRYQDGTKINIGENSNKESFSVGKIVTGTMMDTNIKTFEFDVQKFNPNELHFQQFGLYEFGIKFHWKRNGREMIGKKVDGYIYSVAKGGTRKIKVGLGDFNNDNDIPKPLLQKAEEDSGQPESK